MMRSSASRSRELDDPQARPEVAGLNELDGAGHPEQQRQVLVRQRGRTAVRVPDDVAADHEHIVKGDRR
jgi:hypothetical protein